MSHLYDFYLANNTRNWKNLAQKHHSYETSSLWPSDEVNSNKLLFLPLGSWMLEVEFKLKTPFLSKSENPVNPYTQSGHEIPVTQHIDYFTALPEAKPTTWKGNLLYATKRIKGIQGDLIKRLFGNQEQAGILYFYPTFFKSENSNRNVMGSDIINPLSRSTGTPIEHGLVNLRRVEPGTRGLFRLFFSPRLRGIPENEFVSLLQIALKAVQLMLFDTGFSARKTSGWGIAEKGETKWHLHLHGYYGMNKQSLFLNEDRSIKTEFLDGDGHIISNKKFEKRCAEDIISKKVRKTAFRKFRNEYSQNKDMEQDMLNTANDIFSIGLLGTAAFFNEIKRIEYVYED